MAHQLLLLRVPPAEAAVAAATVLRGCGLSEAQTREALSGGFEPPLLLFETEDLNRLRDVASRATAAGLDIAAVIDDPTALERLQRWWARLKPAPEAASPARSPSRPAAAPGGAAASDSATLSAASAAVGLRERWREMGLGPRIWLVGGGSIVVLAGVLGTVAYVYGNDLPDERLVHAPTPGTPTAVAEAPPPAARASGKTLRIEVAAGSGPVTGTHDVLAGGGRGRVGPALPPPAEDPPTTLEVDAGPAAATQGTRAEGAKIAEDGAPKATVERAIEPRAGGDRPSFFAMLLGLGMGAGIGRKVGLAAARGSTTTRLRTGLVVLAVASLASMGLVTAAWVATGGIGPDPGVDVTPGAAGAPPVAAAGEAAPSAGTFKQFVENHRSASACGPELAPFAKLVCQAREMKGAPAPETAEPGLIAATGPIADTEDPVATPSVAKEVAASPDAGSPQTRGEGAEGGEGGDAAAEAPEAASPDGDVAAGPSGAEPAPSAPAPAPNTGSSDVADASAPPAAPSDESAGGSGAPQAGQGAAAMAPSNPEQTRRAGLGGLLGLLGGLVLSTFIHLFLRGPRQ